MNFINKNELKIDKTLFNFINEEVLPGTNIKPNDFWNRFAKVVHELAPINKKLIEKREKIQKQIDDWHLSNSKEKFDKSKYTQFLKSISYIVDEGDNFKIDTSNVDEEIAKIAGPQLVVPVDNARYALNAANARWGSLYDSLYGTDIIPETKGAVKGKTYNPIRGKKVIEYARNLLDKYIPLKKNSWHDITKIPKINKNRAFDTGHTSCGPQILDISLSTLLYGILKFFPFFLI